MRSFSSCDILSLLCLTAPGMYFLHMRYTLHPRYTH
jgi:hypothetical protein